MGGGGQIVRIHGLGFEELALAPERAEELSLPAAYALIGQIETVKSAVQRRILVERIMAPAPEPKPDRLLKIKEAAEMLGMSVRTLYAEADTFPFTQRQGKNGRQLRFSLKGVQEHIAKRRRV
jgi:predicted DNA-binding transcriptional regulator AlpA